MANFIHEPKGGFCPHAYTPVSYEGYAYTKYGERDVVYIRKDAQKGKLRSVAIKRLYVVDSKHTGGEFRVLYIDTYNSWWNEVDLVPKSAAVALATAFWQGVAAETDKLIKEQHGRCR